MGIAQEVLKEGLIKAFIRPSFSTSCAIPL